MTGKKRTRPAGEKPAKNKPTSKPKPKPKPPTKAAFTINTKECTWSKKDGDTIRTVTNFDLVFESIIRIYNMDEHQWERHYECHLEFMHDAKLQQSTTFRLTPDDCLTVARFQQAIWRINFLRSWFKSDAELQHFFAYLNDYYRPRIVSQFDHFGFIRYEGRRYYLARNLLVEIPKGDEPIRLIAPDTQDCFLVRDNHFIQLDPQLEPAPYFDLGSPDPKFGRYMDDEQDFMAKRAFSRQLQTVKQRLSDMTAGQSQDPVEGEMLVAYVFSFLFFEEIYKTFSHIIFLYVYGRANTGKGKLAEVLLSFFGIPFIDSLTHPTAAALENNLASHSQIPCWIDEFVPELAGKKSKIADQLFNTWFELRIRQISSSADRRRNAAKITRCMLMFCSNYLPETDHLNSRLLKFEYSTARRGDESHYYWLAGHKQLLQQLFLSSLQWYDELDRPFYRSELIRYKKRIKDEVSQRLDDRNEKQGLTYTIEDRQVEQMAALCATHEFITGDSLTKSGFMKECFKRLGEDITDQERRDTQENIRMNTEHDMYQFAVRFLVDNAQEVGQTDPLSEFLNTIAYLVDDNTINDRHFTWTPEGDLKLWWGGIWSAYEKFKGTIPINKELIRRMIAARSDTPHGGTLNWTPANHSKTVRQWGYRIKEAGKDKRFAYAFNWQDPAGFSPDDETPF